MRSAVIIGAVLAGTVAAVGGASARACFAPQSANGVYTYRTGPACPYRLAADKDGLDANGFRKATEPEKKAASTAIEAQLKAFQNDDYETAEKYQSSGLKENFPSRDEFRRMMKEHYPQFANYKSVSFGEARADEKGEVVEIQATVTGKDKVAIKAVYVMVKESGQYRVASVFTPPQQKQNPKDVI